MIDVKIYKVEAEPDGDEELRTLVAELPFNSKEEARDYLANKRFTFTKYNYEGAYADAYKIIDNSISLEAFIKAN